MLDDQNNLSLPEELIRGWGYQIGDAESAFGELMGIPVALTVLGVDPLSLMMAYKIVTPHTAQVPLPAEIAKRVQTKAASVALEDGFAWLSLYHLDRHTAESVRGVFESFAQVLKQHGLALESVCAACGQPEDAGLLFVEGRCTRICETCLSHKLKERDEAEASLNRPSRLHSYALPWVIALAGLGWAVFWVLIDLLLDLFNTDMIEINAFTTIILMGVLALLGYFVGAPLGHVLRKSGSARLSPVAVTAIAIGLAIIIGEALYVSFALFRFFGRFDLAWGFQALVPFFQSYHPSWIACKIFVAIAIGFGCYQAARERESVGLSL